MRLHPQKPLEIYRLNCRHVVCAHCLLVGTHRQHRGQSLPDAFAATQAVQLAFCVCLRVCRYVCVCVCACVLMCALPLPLCFVMLVAIRDHSSMLSILIPPLLCFACFAHVGLRSDAGESERTCRRTVTPTEGSEAKRPLCANVCLRVCALFTGVWLRSRVCYFRAVSIFLVRLFPLTCLCC